MDGLVGGVNKNCNAVIKNCYNIGNIDTSAVTNEIKQIGGLIGSVFSVKNLQITNCYNVGKIITNAAKISQSGGIVGNTGTFTYTAEHNYYIADNVETDDSAKIGESKSEEDMKKQEFVNSLNEGQDKPVWDIRAGENNGFPVLINSAEE